LIAGDGSDRREGDRGDDELAAGIGRDGRVRERLEGRRIGRRVDRREVRAHVAGAEQRGDGPAGRPKRPGLGPAIEADRGAIHERHELRSGRQRDGPLERAWRRAVEPGRAVVGRHEHAARPIAVHRLQHRSSMRRGRGRAPASRSVFGSGYGWTVSGFTSCPLTFVSQCTCGPVVTPLSPMAAMISPALTAVPTESYAALRW